jgi:hypothetical protein
VLLAVATQPLSNIPSWPRAQAAKNLLFPRRDQYLICAYKSVGDQARHIESRCRTRAVAEVHVYPARCRYPQEPYMKHNPLSLNFWKMSRHTLRNLAVPELADSREGVSLITVSLDILPKPRYSSLVLRHLTPQ